ncbi:hypothetical protein Esti_002943 [Eimeria stiedai]
MVLLRFTPPASGDPLALEESSADGSLGLHALRQQSLSAVGAPERPEDWLDEEYEAALRTTGALLQKGGAPAALEFLTQKHFSTLYALIKCWSASTPEGGRSFQLQQQTVLLLQQLVGAVSAACEALPTEQQPQGQLQLLLQLQQRLLLLSLFLRGLTLQQDSGSSNSNSSSRRRCIKPATAAAAVAASKEGLRSVFSMIESQLQRLLQQRRAAAAKKQRRAAAAAAAAAKAAAAAAAGLIEDAESSESEEATGDIEKDEGKIQVLDDPSATGNGLCADAEIEGLLSALTSEEPLPWLSPLNAVLLQHESRLVVAVVSQLREPRGRMRLLPLLVLRELAQQLKEQVLLSASSGATTAQRDSLSLAAAALEAAAQQMPGAWLQQQQLLLQLFASDFYLIRKALLECIKTLILKAYAVCDLGEPHEREGEEIETERGGGNELASGGAGYWLESEEEQETDPTKQQQQLQQQQRLAPSSQVPAAAAAVAAAERQQRRQQQVRLWAAQRQQLLQLLLQRLHDKLPLARSWCLKVLGELMDRGVLSAAAVAAVAAAAAERVRDKSALVRAAALQVLTAAVQLAVRQQQQRELQQPFVLLLADEHGELRRRLQQQQQQQQQQLKAAAAAAAASAAATPNTEGQGDSNGEPATAAEAAAAAAAAAAAQTTEAVAGAAAGAQGAAEEEEEDPMLRLVVMAEDALDTAISLACELLSSKSDVDQKAACRFLVDLSCLLQLQRRKLLLPLRLCLRLSFSRVTAVSEFAAAQFHRLFINPKTLQVQQQLLREQRELASELRRQRLLQPQQQQQQRQQQRQGDETQEDEEEEQQQQQQQLLRSAANGCCYRLAAMRLLQLIWGTAADRRDLASLEKTFLLLLDQEGSSIRVHLKKLLHALFVLALQPNVVLGRDEAPRCALGLVNLIILASRTSCDSQRALRPLQQQQQQQVLLHRLTETQLRALEGALRHQAAAAAGGGATVRGGEKKPSNSLIVFAELSFILANAVSDSRTARAASTAVRLLLQHLGSRDTNWFAAAQAVVDASFAHCANADRLWGCLLAHALHQLLTAAASFQQEQQQRRFGLGCAAAAEAASEETPDSSCFLPSSAAAAAAAPTAAAAAAAACPLEPIPIPLPPLQRQPTAMHLAQLLFLAGHVALRTCAHLEKLQQQLKQLRHLKEGTNEGPDPQQEQQQQEQQQQQQQEQQQASTSARKKQQQQQVEENLGMQTREEEETELLQHAVEHGITQTGLLGGPYKRLLLLAAFKPMQLLQRMQLRCTNGEGAASTEKQGSAAAATAAAAARLLQQAAVLSVAKYASISKAFCEEVLGGTTTILHALLSLLFTKADVAGGPPQQPRGAAQEEGPPGLKDAILVCFGDLTCRHPNALEPYNPWVISLLRESELCGQLTAVHILTHLTMTGMVKPRGKLLVNMLLLQLQQQQRDWRVAEAAKTFFFEVDRKDPIAMLSAMPELLNALAVATAAAPSSSKYSPAAAAGGGDTGATAMALVQERQRLHAFLLQFVKGRRQSETLIDKICLRLSSLVSRAPPGGPPATQGPLLSLEDGSGEAAEALMGASHGGGGFSAEGAGGSAQPGVVAACCIGVYLEALSSIIVSAPNMARALQRLSSCWYLLRSLVASSEAAAAGLTALCRRCEMKAAGRAKSRAANAAAEDRANYAQNQTGSTAAAKEENKGINSGCEQQMRFSHSQEDTLADAEVLSDAGGPAAEGPAEAPGKGENEGPPEEPLEAHAEAAATKPQRKLRREATHTPVSEHKRKTHREASSTNCCCCCCCCFGCIEAAGCLRMGQITAAFYVMP